jgi:ribosome biogenesis GTPase
VRVQDLGDLGWDDAWAAAAAAVVAAPGDVPVPARIAIEHRGAYEVLGADGGYIAELPGKAYRAARDRRALPAVGDWVLVTGAAAAAASGSSALVRAVLPRRGLIIRQAAGERVAPQPLAANVDLAFVVTSANGDLNPRRLERYLALVTAGGARPIIVLNKIDLSPDPEAERAAIAAAAPGVEIALTSAARGDAGAIAAHLGRGVTAVLCGSSGVGKSTLVNALAALAGDAARPTRAIDAATDRGRHATTRRELFALPSGGVIIDTPGMRELALWDDDPVATDAGFADLAAIAVRCKFADCRHGAEPGCAVRAAVADGSLPTARWAAYAKLDVEARAAEARRLAAAKAAERRKVKVVNRSERAHQRDKRRGE